MFQKTLLVLISGYLFIPELSLAEARWYSDEQVSNGATLYATHCAECHKSDAEGTKDWRKTGSNGKYPPPPLNGSAHTWHHSMKVLSNTIHDGGIKLGGVMPAFKDKLDAGQTLDVIAFFQSKWDDKIYAAWQERNPLPEQLINKNSLSVPVGKSDKSDKSGKPVDPVDPRVTNLKKLLPGKSLGVPEKTPLKGIYQVKVGGKYAYVTENGEFALIGNLLDLKNGINLTQQAMARDIVPLLSTFPEKDSILFKADGKEKTVVTVFSDTSCPFCKKFHKEVPVLQKAGVSVRYIPFPRGMDKGPGFKEMLSVWCAKDRVEAMNIAMGVSQGKLDKGDCGAESILKAGFEVGVSVGVTGTPTSYLSDGNKVRGYVAAEKIIKRLVTRKILQK